MSTWHQRQRPVRLAHETLWTVVTDPPNEMTTVLRGTEAQAREHLRNLQQRGDKHSCLLAPHR